MEDPRRHIRLRKGTSLHVDGHGRWSNSSKLYRSLGRTFGPFDITFGDTETNFGDTGITPITLGWHSGNWWWNAGVTGFVPTGKYDKRDLANTSLNHWSVFPTAAITYFNPKAQWQVSAAFVYAINFE